LQEQNSLPTVAPSVAHETTSTQFTYSEATVNLNKTNGLLPQWQGIENASKN